ncbi:MAG: TIGR03067 domain-containing protein [Planctomycetes bacterium]|nr:TIGR03067 domain-containing protein [Planctomycetota bacterium]MBL7043715.1 TIGR03067 domain-containing protein [Pirellulaceae bacterium]
MRRTVILAIVALTFLLFAGTTAEARKWTDNTGQFSVEATAIEIRDDKVLLMREDGKVSQVSITRLSKADQEYLAVLKQLQGTWHVTSAMANGQLVPKEFWEKKHVITGNNVVVTQHSGETILLEIEIYPAKAPKQIDAVAQVEDKAIFIHGIYAVDSNELKLCFGQPGKSRPGEFSTKEGDMQSLAVLKRVPREAAKGPSTPGSQAPPVDPSSQGSAPQ